MTEPPRTILVVQDDPNIKNILEEYAQTDGGSRAAKFIEAASLEAALEQLEAQDFDLIMIDLALEENSELNIFRGLHEAYPEIPILILTGPENEKMALKTLEMGSRDYLIKGELNSHWLDKAINYTLKHQETEQQYKTIFTESSEPIFIRGPDKKIVDANEALCELLGYEREALLQTPVEDLYPSDCQAEPTSAIKDSVLAQHNVKRFEKRIKRADGTQLPVEISLTPITYRGQQSLLTFVRNISERKKSRVEHRQTSHRLELARSAAQLGIWKLDLKRDTFVLEDRLLERMGLEPNTYEDLLEIIHPADRGAVETALEQTIGTGEPFHEQFRVAQTDTDETQWINCRADVQYDDRGEPAAIVGANQDITAIKNTKLKLQKANEHFKLAEKFADLGNWSLKLPERELTWSDQVYRILGLAPEDSEPELETLFEMLPEPDRKKARKQFRETLEEGKELDIEHRVCSPDGTIRHCHTYGIPRSKDGELVEIFGIIQDISKQKQAQQQLEERYKEQRCLHSITALDETEYDEPASLLEELVRRIPPGYQFPDRTHARIKYNEFEVTSEGFEETPLRQNCTLTRDEETVGQVEVYVKKPEAPETQPFIPEEEDLLQTTARLISEKLSRFEMKRELNQFLERVTNAYISIDEEFRVQIANPPAQQIIHHPLEEIIGEKLAETFPAMQGSEFQKACRRAMEEQETESLEEYFTPIDKWFRILIYPSQSGLTIFLRDITKQRKAEHESQRSNRRLQLAREAAGMGIVEWEIETGQLHLDEKARELFGQEELCFNEFIELILPEDRSQIKQTLQRAVENKEKFQTSCRFKNEAKGEVRWLESRGLFHKSEAEGKELIVGVVRDITKSKRAAKKLENSEKRFRQLAENIEEVFWITSPDNSEMYYVSPAYEKIWGRPVEELYESPEKWLEFIHPEDRQKVTETVQDATEGHYEIDYRIRQPSGEIRWIHDKGFPVKDESGEIQRAVGVAADITEPKKRQQELEEQKQDLQQALEDKNTLIKEVHHRVRNNLQNIISLLSLTSRNASNPVAESILQQSISRIRSIALVHKQLYLAENMASISASDYINQLAETLVTELNPESEIKSEIDVSPEIQLDPETLTTLGLILNELISNSIEHAFDGPTGTISITMQEMEAGYELVVQDNGKGIDETEAESSSLGLTLTRNLAERQLKGTIEITASETGTQARLTLPGS